MRSVNQTPKSPPMTVNTTTTHTDTRDNGIR